jgi:hypothetical protein
MEEDVRRVPRACRRGVSHPLLPGFLERALQRCPGLSDAVISLLAQARTCLDYGLMQPAIVLMGVAYEAAVEQVVDVLVARSQLPAGTEDKKPAKRISIVKAQPHGTTTFAGSWDQGGESR